MAGQLAEGSVSANCEEQATSIAVDTDNVHSEATARILISMP